ncbi:MAG: hypothetical protein H6Q78_54 [Candidatus Krumholzibacteriota bacterium]|nr:hypothetical protein [Candidatus Krumholzibacteriota bacterium]
MILIGVATVILCCGEARRGFADLVHGIGPLSEGGWDFSESTSVDPKFDSNTDLTLVYVVDPPIGSRAWGLNGAVIVMVDSSFVELTTAPEDTALYDWDWPAVLGETYVIRTTERHYAKFRILNLIIPTIEYVYQPDGSRMLAEGVPVEATTWGRVKSLYHEDGR